MRQILEYAKMALRNITSNKMRSLLTMLGIIIGIAAVIIVLCIGNGMQVQVEEQLSFIAGGTSYIYVWGNDSTTADYFTLEDIKAIGRLPGVHAVTMLDEDSGNIRGTRETISCRTQAGNGGLMDAVPVTLERGRLWDEGDNEAARRVCTIDSAGARELFGSDNVVGMAVQLTLYGRTFEYTITGITKSTSMYGGMGGVTAEVRIPINTLTSSYDMFGPPFYQLVVMSEDPNESYAVAQQAVTQLEMRHNNGGREMYYIQDVNMYMEEMNTVLGLMTSVIAVIAGISLLVGGIGVMNIMLVSVTERTREIGIRKALGAKTRTILFQFLVESATLTLLGGIIGIIIGVLGGYALGSVMGMKASIGAGMVAAIVLFSSAIGIFFGIYPARKAARLNPIEALRSE